MPRLRALITALSLATLVACDSSPSAPGADVDPSFAKGGGGGGPGINVDSTDPSEATQDTTLNVRVRGSGFEPGYQATWLLDRAATPHVVTNSTAFVSETELTANITITLDAEVALYDVEVRSGNGRRRGIGTELFQVQEGVPAEMEVRDPESGDAVWNDGDPLYVDGVEYASVTITDGDFHFKPGVAKKGKKAGPDRDIYLDLGTPTDPQFDDPWGPHLLNSLDFRIHQGLVNRPCGTSQTHGRFAWGSSLGYAHLAFDVPNVDFEGDPLTVTRVDNGDGTSTWTIVSTGEGYLRVDNQYAGTFLMPFEFTVTGEPGGCPESS